MAVVEAVARTAAPDTRSRSLTPLEGGILGLLARGGTLSGWDLQKQAQTSVAYFWPIGRSQIYAALPRLESAGLIRGRNIRQDGRPDKRVFRLTDRGRDTLAAWLRAGQDGPARDLFLLKLFFGAHTDRPSVRRLIHDRRTMAQRLLAEIEDMSDSPDLDDFFHRLTRDCGRSWARAVIDWADEALSSLDALDAERGER